MRLNAGGGGPDRRRAARHGDRARAPACPPILPARGRRRQPRGRWPCGTTRLRGTISTKSVLPAPPGQRQRGVPVPKTAPTRRASRPARGRIPRAARGVGPATRAWRKGVAGGTKKGRRRSTTIPRAHGRRAGPGPRAPRGARRAARPGPPTRRARARGGNAAAAAARGCVVQKYRSTKFTLRM